MPNKFTALILFLILQLTGLVYAQSPSAEIILQRADSVMNAPQDLYAVAEMTLTEADGDQSVRKMEMYQKGDEKRLVRFLAPADQRGISFLSLPDDVKYLYLPAFRKVRRIASHMENQRFAGTDFSYEDLSSASYSNDYNPTLIETTAEHFVLDLQPQLGNENSSYSRLKAWILKENYYPEKIEMYDDSGNLWKVLEQRQIIRQDDYWIAKEMQMTDVQEDHSTTSVMSEIELDSGLDGKIFTRRFLMRVR